MEVGAVQDTKTCALPAVPVTPVGAPGTPSSGIGVTGAEGADALPVPAKVVAVTVKTYEVPFVKPATVQVKAPVVVQVLPSGFEVTV